jgi:hypothetical protein
VILSKLDSGASLCMSANGGPRLSLSNGHDRRDALYACPTFRIGQETGHLRTCHRVGLTQGLQATNVGFPGSDCVLGAITAYRKWP